MAKINSFDIRKSPFVDQIKVLKAANPKLTPTELADAANGLLEKSGIAFAFSFDAATCEKIRRIKDQQKDPNTTIKHRCDAKICWG